MKGNRRNFWIEHLKGCSDSELNHKEYCKNHNINYNTFKYWQNKIKKEKTSGSKFVKIPFTNENRINSDLTIILKNGIQIKTSSQADLESIKILTVSLKDI